MSNGKRSVGLFGFSGVLVAALIITAFLAMGTIFQARGKGTLTIQIMDKPTQLSHLNITIDSIRIRNVTGGWVDLTLIPSPSYFDLLSLQNVSETLSKTQIPAGNYSLIEMHVLTANATYIDESTSDLRVPSDVIKVFLQPELTLKDEGQVTVLIDLQPDDANTIAISQSLNLRPVIRAVVTETT